MLQSTTMTYLIVGKTRESVQPLLKNLLEKLWNREVRDEEIFSEKNPDIHILDGRESNSLGIEDIKRLQKEMMFSPFKERVQIAYILDAEKLTPQAQNSLLKTLEESSGNTAYILITKNDKSLLPTVLSRCLKLYTNINLQEDIESKYINILEIDTVEAFVKIEEIAKEKSSTESFLRELERYFQAELERKLVEKNSIIGVSSNIKQVMIAQKRIKANGNKRLILENLLLHLVR
ncbi:hypothetical protein CVU76_03085 [Candidatus Dojkabacteria bacterium HGW-Dojkabacteria-1]|uniref:DNA polymerase III subunit delta n=1 Tax=Candidatus Dojkabacteria bacterium HGW-Dojkabacteria-1 TaxID=2013761 RepID=A0A2N2F439_9BACT|nr:MAG: hypothetical protein CVU76_03085 [Candidatus Dojkabacteria bacterium HGW-Dojkabacteria-1]